MLEKARILLTASPSDRSVCNLPGPSLPLAFDAGALKPCPLCVPAGLRYLVGVQPFAFVSPADRGVRTLRPGDTVRAPGDAEGPANFSYAFLDFAGMDNDGRPPQAGAESLAPGRQWEWKETINTQAVVLADRNTGADADRRISSVWTEENSGDWRGGVTRNDSSTSTETEPVLPDLQYGLVRVAWDHLFVDEPQPVPDDLLREGRANVAQFETANAYLIVGPEAAR